MSFEHLVLMPEIDARRALADTRLTLRMLRPPYPAIGRGRLRVLRVREHDDAIELLAGYEGYERLPQ